MKGGQRANHNRPSKARLRGSTWGSWEVRSHCLHCNASLFLRAPLLAPWKKSRPSHEQKAQDPSGAIWAACDFGVLCEGTGKFHAENHVSQTYIWLGGPHLAFAWGPGCPRDETRGSCMQSPCCGPNPTPVKESSQVWGGTFGAQYCLVFGARSPRSKYWFGDFC